MQWVIEWAYKPPNPPGSCNIVDVKNQFWKKLTLTGPCLEKSGQSRMGKPLNGQWTPDGDSQCEALGWVLTRKFPGAYKPPRATLEQVKGLPDVWSFKWQSQDPNQSRNIAKRPKFPRKELQWLLTTWKSFVYGTLRHHQELQHPGCRTKDTPSPLT